MEKKLSTDESSLNSAEPQSGVQALRGLIPLLEQDQESLHLALLIHGAVFRNHQTGQLMVMGPVTAHREETVLQAMGLDTASLESVSLPVTRLCQWSGCVNPAQPHETCLWSQTRRHHQLCAKHEARLSITCGEI